MARSDHNGLSPIIDVMNLGDFALDVKMKFLGQSIGRSGLDCDHHLLALRAAGNGVGIFTNDSGVLGKRVTGYPFALNRWYHVLAREPCTWTTSLSGASSPSRSRRGRRRRPHWQEKHE